MAWPENCLPLLRKVAQGQSMILENRRMDAKAYGVTFTPEGRIHQDQARAILPQIVIIRITLGSPR